MGMLAAQSVLEGDQMRPTLNYTKLKLDRCKGCDAVGLVEIGEVPMCGRCLPNAYAIHLAEETVKRAAQKT